MRQRGVVDMLNVFYDSNGSFQWAVITTFVAVLVLFAQVIQFFVQRKEIRRTKTYDSLIAYRLTDLGKLKQYIMEYDEFISKEVINPSGQVLRNRDSLNLLLNSDNEHYQRLSHAIAEYSIFLTACQSGQIAKDDQVLFLIDHSNQLIDAFKAYEQFEMTSIKDKI